MALQYFKQLTVYGVDISPKRSLPSCWIECSNDLPRSGAPSDAKHAASTSQFHIPARLADALETGQ